MSNKPCSVCHSPIDPERLEVLPDTIYCVTCARSHVSKRVAFMDYSHKTAPQLVVIEGTDEEGLRRAKRAFKRAR